MSLYTKSVLYVQTQALGNTAMQDCLLVLQLYHFTVLTKPIPQIPCVVCPAQSTSSMSDFRNIMVRSVPVLLSLLILQIPKAFVVLVIRFPSSSLSASHSSYSSTATDMTFFWPGDSAILYQLYLPIALGGEFCDVCNFTDSESTISSAGKPWRPPSRLTSNSRDFITIPGIASAGIRLR